MADQHSSLPEARILGEAARRYALTPTQLTPLMVDENTHVYAFDRHGQSFILKWLPSWEQPADEVAAEVDWVNYLADHDVPVARAVPSANGVLVEVIPVDNVYVSLVAYQRARGERPAGSALNATLFHKWGAVMGMMHRLAPDYTRAQSSVRLPTWDASAQLDRAQIPSDQAVVHEKWDALMQQLQALPRDDATYGLIHGDLQANNIVVAGGKLTVIDFAACEISWFARDIATTLYFYLWEPHPTQDNHAFAASFLQYFLEGYTREHVLDAFWIAQLPTFLKLQELQVYAAINAFNGLAQGGEVATIPEKHRRLLTRYRQNIEQGIPYLDGAYNPW